MEICNITGKAVVLLNQNGSQRKRFMRMHPVKLTDGYTKQSEQWPIDGLPLSVNVSGLMFRGISQTAEPGYFWLITWEELYMLKGFGRTTEDLLVPDEVVAYPSDESTIYCKAFARYSD